ncbi:metal ABC transporter substrate-binding protein [Longispora sp. K20-0274]|uniref:metal ABC transporter substrate-binding protein n=1 Tax=Longispora sp. K20-0274 TaxID=3088255 RepID=UPI00399A378A
MFTRPLALAAAVLAAGALAACSGAGTADGKVSVVAAAYPFQWISERVGGGDVKVTNLVKPGAEPHDVELTAAQTALIADAKLVVYLPTFQPAVDEAVAQNAKDRAFDVAAVQPLADIVEDGHAGKDPHVWLDPTRLATIADQVADRLAKIDPTHADGYRTRAGALRAELDAIDKEYAAGLKTCQRTEIVTAHEAFGYLAARYHLKQVGIAGLSPDEEPSAQKIAEIIRDAKEHQATVIFTEALVSPKVAETIAKGAGAKTQVLDPIESLPAGSSDDYAKIMRSNLGQIRAALGCS